jgi:60 kDa SS-A/Ro ribonucleoprotein
MNYSDTLIDSLTNVPQTSPLIGRKNMVENNAGGYVFNIDEMKVLDRFLIIGTEQNTYYVSSKELTLQAATNVLKLISTSSKQVVDRIVEISLAGRAPKNDSAIFALALACIFSSTPEEKAYAFDALPLVCRIGTHLFQFVDVIKKLGKWNAAAKRGISNWYNSKDLESLAFQMLKYQRRNNWSHKDVLRLAHVKPNDLDRSALYAWATDNKPRLGQALSMPDIVIDYKNLHVEPDLNLALTCIEKYNMSWEMMPTQFLNIPEIWEALLPKLGYTALIRNLGRMGSIGMLESLSDFASIVIDKLLDENLIKRGKVHPLTIFSAYKTYKQGKGDKGSLFWKVNNNIVDALDKAFYKAFSYIEPTGKKYLIGLDCSGSMFSTLVLGMNLNAAEAAAIMAMSIIKTEKNVWVGGFDTSISELPLTSSMSLQEVLRTMQRFKWGGTDCSQPFIYANKNNMDVDCFITFTDNETWAGATHPTIALDKYRSKMKKPNAKSIVCGTSVSHFTIADPNDPNQLDLVGFDSAIPMLVSGFVK